MLIKWIIIGLISAVVFFWLIPAILTPIIIYNILFVRTSDKKWTRECSLKDDEEQKEMYSRGEKWGNTYVDCMTEISITNEGFKLVGQYFDFGSKKAVIVIAGRSEACRYSCYFSEPYRRAGYNVLCIDNRSHGFSDGKYNNIGFKEYKDILAWGKHLHDSLNNEQVICHGICIGSATAMYALTSPGCPDYMAGLVADGMYVTFRESFKNHLIEMKKPCFPTEQLLMLIITLRSGTNAFKEGPIRRIKSYTKPILFLYSKQDSYSVPEKGQLLYDMCKSKKQLTWFEKGVHSHLRINAEQKYDDTIVKFLQETF